jgi:hypothetical protein
MATMAGGDDCRFGIACRIKGCLVIFVPAIWERMRMAPAGLLPALLLVSLGGCAAAGAPSFALFGAFFPAWMLCAFAGILAAIAARAIFLATGLAGLLPYQLFLCTAIGVIAAILPWLLVFER